MSSQPPFDPHKIAIVGAGNVGATFGFALLLEGLAGEIVLIDVAREKAEGEAMDLLHSTAFTAPTRVRVGEYADCAGAEVVMIAAGTAQREGETRLDLLKRNASIFQDIVPQIVEHNKTGILLVATNPVDVLSYVACRASGFASARVIGSGTILDTARFRSLLGEYFRLDARSIHAYILGEHGDSEFPVWSLANIAGMRLEDYCASVGCDFSQEDRERIFARTRDAAYEIIKKKGATSYAVAAGLTRIVESVLRNQRTVLTVSTLLQGQHGIEDVYLSLPAVIGSDGVAQVLELRLSPDEVAALRHSAGVLSEALDQIGVR